MSLSAGSVSAIGENRGDVVRVGIQESGYRALEARLALDDGFKRVALEGNPERLPRPFVELALQHEPLVSHVDLLHECQALEDHAFSDRVGPERKYSNRASKESEL